MKILLNILLFILISPTIVWSQLYLKTRKENQQIFTTKSDSFLQQSFGYDRFTQYLRYDTQHQYFFNGSEKRFLIDDPYATHIENIYWLEIPKIKYKKRISVVYDKELDKYYLEDSIEIPNFILKNTALNLLDTSSIITLLLNRGVSDSKLLLIGCSYNLEFNRFVWTVEKHLKSESTRLNIGQNWWHGTEYIIDAITGKMLRIKHGKHKSFLLIGG